MAQSEIFLKSVESQLVSFYEDLKRTNKANEITKARIEGYMLAGVHLGLTDNEFLQKMVSDVHWSVFGKSIEQRRMDKALAFHSDRDWDIYDKPSHLRAGQPRGG